MKIAITLKENAGLDSTVSPIFGRCPYYMFIDPDTKEFTIEENTAMNESGGAGIKAAQFIVDRKAAAVDGDDLQPSLPCFLADLPGLLHGAVGRDDHTVLRLDRHEAEILVARLGDDVERDRILVLAPRTRVDADLPCVRARGRKGLPGALTSDLTGRKPCRSEGQRVGEKGPPRGARLRCHDRHLLIERPGESRFG